MNAIKHATQLEIQTTFWTLKNISQQENVKHLDPKPQTHTLNESNQFYVSKTN